jgi:hypothetical protein
MGKFTRTAFQSETCNFLGIMKMKCILYSLGIVLTASAAEQQSFSAEELSRRTLERRAVEAVIWGMPAVNTDLMLQEMLTKTKGKVNQFIYWGWPDGLAQPDAHA